MTHINRINQTQSGAQNQIGAQTEIGAGLPAKARARALRWGLSVPMGALMTLGLGVTMAGLIAVEFMPQDKVEPLKLDINPVPIDIKDFDSIEPPEQLRDVEVPPPPPQTGVTQADKVSVRPIEASPVEIKINPDLLEITKHASLNIDTDYQPLVRTPPIMPSRAERSGHCKVRFDVSPQGQPFNVEATYCSEKLFAKPTIKSIQRWKFRPKSAGGQNLTVQGVENVVRFRLTDESGQIIAE